MTCPAVTLGGKLLDGGPDADGIVWATQRLDGWWDSTSIRSALLEAQPMGELVTVGRENARALVLQVIAMSPTPNVTPLGEVGIFRASETIKAAARAVYLPALMLVNDPIIAAQAYVRRVGAIKQTIIGQLVAAQFQIPLLAPDPRRYRQTLDDDTFTLAAGVGTVTQNVTTAGDADTPFIAILRGPTTNPKVLSHSLGTPSTRPFFQWIGALANSADLLVVDTAAGTVLHNGVDASGGLAAGSSMFDLIPGVNSLDVTRTVTTGISTNTIRRRDAFD